MVAKGMSRSPGVRIFGWVGKFLGISGITESMTPQCKCFGWVEGLFFFHHFEMDNVFGLVQFVWLRRYYKCSVVIYWKKKISGWKGRMCEELRGCSCMLLVWSGKFYFHQGVLNRVSVATMSYSMPVFLQCKKSTPVLFQTIFCCQNSK